MKKQILAFAALVIFSTVDVKADDKLEFCSVLGKIAETTMILRQKGIDMEIIVNAYYNKKTELNLDEGSLNLAMAMVKDAYSRPIFTTESIKQRVISEFKNAVYVQCIKKVTE